jgi:hypothetical protein
MPIWLRKFTYQSIANSIEEENKKLNPKKNNNTTTINPANPNKNDIPVTYTSNRVKKP